MEQVSIPFSARIKLASVSATLWVQNSVLSFFRVMFFRKIQNPKNILIFKVGNIGDIVCAIPALVAIRKEYPNAHITLLTSPGEQGMLGAKELIAEGQYIDKLRVYYANEIRGFSGKWGLIQEIKRNSPDLFIQIPDDYVRFSTLLRNVFFAKATGAIDARGFRVRTLLNLFKKTQVDYLFSEKCEVEGIVHILRDEKVLKNEHGIVFLFPEITAPRRAAIDEQIQVFKKELSGPLVAINLSAKREANEWPPERFEALAKNLIEKYAARVLFIGGPRDARIAGEITKKLPRGNFCIVAPNFSLLETRLLLSQCDFLASNDTGAVHLAASTGTSVVGLYTVRNVFGKWFPYGEKNIILAHRFFSCDYNQESCIHESIQAISFDEVFAACEKIIEKIKKYE